jgi:excisionase family DNA binding protein
MQPICLTTPLHDYYGVDIVERYDTVYGGHRQRGSKMQNPTAGADSVLRLMADGLDTVPAAAKFLGISRTSLYGLMDKGLLEYVKLGKARRIPHRAVLELAARNLVSSRTPTP